MENWLWNRLTTHYVAWYEYSVVGITIRYRLDGSGSNSGRGKRFSLPHRLPDRTWYPKINIGTLPLLQSCRDVASTTHSIKRRVSDWVEPTPLLPSCVFMVCYRDNFTYIYSGFGGLGVACWPLVPKFAGSNPAEVVGFLGRKNPQHAFLRRRSKAVGPMS